MRHQAARIKTTLLIAMSLALLLVLAPGCAEKEQSWEKIVEEGQLKIGLDPSFPPFEATDGTTVYGIDVDLADALTAEMGLETVFIHFGYDGLYDALLSKQVDVLISALALFPERTKDFAYSESYFDAGQVLLSSGKLELERLEDLDDQTIGVELGAEGHTLASSWQRQKPSLTVKTYASADEALNALNNSEIDLSVVDMISALLYIGSTKMPAETYQVTNEPFALVVRSEDTLLLGKLNSTLNKIKESGQLDRILNKWLGQ